MPGGVTAGASVMPGQPTAAGAGYSRANLSSAVFKVSSFFAKQKRTTFWSKPWP